MPVWKAPATPHRYRLFGCRSYTLSSTATRDFAAAGRRAGAFDEEVAIALPGGTLSLCWPGAGEPLWMTGPAAVSFRGEIGE